MRLIVPLTLGLLIGLGACGDSASGDGVGGVTAGEARALNDAAEMLDRRPASPAAREPNAQK